MDTGLRRAAGQGSCSSYEKKYRYRNALATCPTCDKENVRASNSGGFYCWKKTGGCGASFHHDDERITGQTIGQVINDDPMEQANTILKMAIKRAEVDAALRLPGVARFFTQDLEDMHPEPASQPEKPVQPRSRRPVPAATQPQPEPPVSITFDQLKADVGATGMTWAQFEIQVLGKTWDTFVKTKGASATVAKKMWENWRQQQEAQP
jgi:hypothetical protein